MATKFQIYANKRGRVGMGFFLLRFEVTHDPSRQSWTRGGLLLLLFGVFFVSLSSRITKQLSVITQIQIFLPSALLLSISKLEQRKPNKSILIDVIKVSVNSWKTKQERDANWRQLKTFTSSPSLFMHRYIPFIFIMQTYILSLVH